MLRSVGVHFSVNRMLAADCYKTRLASDNGLTFFEMNYMIMQAYDFYTCTKTTTASWNWAGTTSGPT